MPTVPTFRITVSQQGSRGIVVAYSNPGGDSCDDPFGNTRHLAKHEGVNAAAAIEPVWGSTLGLVSLDGLIQLLNRNPSVGSLK